MSRIFSISEYKRLVQANSKPKSGGSGYRSINVTSKGEAILTQHLKVHGIEFEQEFKFHPDRKWRADFLITGHMLLVEVEGGIWNVSRHTTGKGYQADMEKYNAAAMLGYTVLRFSTADVKSGKAIEQLLGMVMI